MTCLALNIKYWSYPDLNSMRWLGLFTNKTFRKHLKLIFPHRDFIICIVSLAIFHPHFVIRIFPSAFYHPHFIILIFPSAFFYPPSAIRHPPPSGPHFTETPFHLNAKENQHATKRSLLVEKQQDFSDQKRIDSRSVRTV